MKQPTSKCVGPLQGLGDFDKYKIAFEFQQIVFDDQKLVQPQDQAARRREDESCSYYRGSRMRHFCGGARNNSVHELGADCTYCRDGRCPYCI